MADFLNCPRPPPTHLSSGRRAVRPSYGAALVARGLCGPLDNRALRAAARPGLRTYSRHSCKSLASRSKSARASTVVHSAAARALGPHGHAHGHTAHGTRSRRDVHMGSLRRGSNELRLCGAIHTALTLRTSSVLAAATTTITMTTHDLVVCRAVLCCAVLVRRGRCPVHVTRCCHPPMWTRSHAPQPWRGVQDQTGMNRACPMMMMRQPL